MDDAGGTERQLTEGIALQAAAMPALVAGDSPRFFSRVEVRIASGMLLLGTVFWGASFTWSKIAFAAASAALGNRADDGGGTLLILALRFGLAGVIWFACFGRSRRGWTWAGLWRVTGVGVLLAAGMLVQSLGLNRTSEAVSAFLTSLTILFVPILMAIWLRRPPRAVLWLGVLLATAGVWIMTGAQPTGFGWGEIFGLACALGFSIYILVINAAVARDDPFRISGGQFIACGLACFAAYAIRGGDVHGATLVHVVQTRGVGLNLVWLTLLSTVLSYGLLTHFQPRIDPTRAALVYLLEPVFATIFAAIVAHRYLSAALLLGGGLIIVANLLVELLTLGSSKATEIEVR